MLQDCCKNAKIQESSQKSYLFWPWIIKLAKKHVFQHINFDKFDVIYSLSWFFYSLGRLIVYLTFKPTENWYHHVSDHAECKKNEATYQSLPSCNKEQTCHREEQAL